MAKPPHLEMSVVVSFSEIFNRPATLEGAREVLSQNTRDAVLLVLAKLSAGLRIWFRPDYQNDNGLARDVFKNARRVEAHSMAGNPRRLFFTGLGVLATARLALSACNRPEASDITEPQQAGARVGVRLNDERTYLQHRATDRLADLLVHQLANHNAMAHYDFRGDLLRSLAMFERNRALLASQPGTVDLEAEFRRDTGLSPRQFIELCLVIGTRYRMMDAGSLISNDLTFFVDKNRFGNMKIGDAELTSLGLARYSKTTIAPI